MFFRSARSLRSYASLVPGAAPSKYGGKSLEAALRHCVELVRERDPEFFKWATVALGTKEDRAPVLVLKALQIEIESIQQAARTETLLRMRYQWWRDSITKAFSSRKSYEMAQPVMKAFSELVQSYDTISDSRVHAMLDAYELDAMRGDAFFPSLEDLEKHARDTVGALVALQMEACGVDRDVVEGVAPALGTGVGMTSALRRSLGLLSEYGISYLPEDVCRRHGVQPDNFFDGSDKREELRGVVGEIAETARSHLENASSAGAQRATGSRGKAFLLQGLASTLYLDGLRRNRWDLLTAGGVSPVGHLLRLKWNTL
jgi:phytoene/squalene synthetase